MVQLPKGRRVNNNPCVAVLISDIHFTVSTLELASASLKAAQTKAKELDVPLIIAGDTLDSKAIMRGECVNRLIALIGAKNTPPTFILCGNHDKLNEKSEEHTLNFLKPHCAVIDKPSLVDLDNLPVLLIPYQSDTQYLKTLLADDTNCKTLIMHQGVNGAEMGHYVRDDSSLPGEYFKNYRVISGHYHRRQAIKCGPPRRGMVGMFSYIGNPYTLSFGEADHSPKGYQILHEDGSLSFVPLNLRKHVVITCSALDLCTDAGLSTHTIEQLQNINEEDLIWLKLTGAPSQLKDVDKTELGLRLFGHTNYKLDKIPLEASKERKPLDESKPATEADILDNLIDKLSEPSEHKKALKELWRSIV